MDEAKLSELGRWAASLEHSEAAELRAAGRAIAALVADNEALARQIAKLERRDAPPPPPATDGEQPDAPERPRRRAPWRRAIVVFVALVVAVAAVALAAQVAQADLSAGGPSGTIGPTRLDTLAFWSVAGARQTWTLDGRPLSPAHAGDRLVLTPHGLRDGEHVLVIRAEERLRRSTTRTFRFVVDTTAPLLRLEAPAIVHPGAPVRIAGTLEAGAKLAVGKETVAVDDRGRFVYRHAALRAARLVFATTDAAGNESRWRVPVTVVPRRPAQPIRAVHVTAYAWADEGLRAGVLELVRAGRINAVELDLKDESGEVGWNAPVPYGKRMGAVKRIYDLGAAVALLHRQGVRVIGRLVCFRDPIHAKAAWDAGRRDEVVQAPGGGPYAGYGGFTNFASSAVRRYQIDLAVAAAKLGVDEVLYDYVRRPDGPRSSMVFPGLEGTPERSIVGFLRETRAALAGTDVLLGASVFGVAATRPLEVAQDIPSMARQVDYVAPMVYPSHWAPGEYGVADPNGSPYEITQASVADFVRLARGTGARIVPWLQDFSLGRDYGAAEVAAQIEASRDAGADEFLLWDAAVTYTADALSTGARTPALAVVTTPPPDAPGPTRLPVSARAAPS